MGQGIAWGRFFFCVRSEAHKERVYIDGTYVRLHQHASGSRIGELRKIGMSRSGNSTIIHTAADANANPIYFEITGGDAHDSKGAENPISPLEQLK